MPTLNISGKRVKVDESFLSLSPEQQNQTVEEIASSMGGAEMPAQEAQQPQAQPDRFLDTGSAGAFTSGAQSGMTFGFDDELYGAVAAPFGAAKDWMQGKGFNLSDAYDRNRQAALDLKKQDQENHPIANTVGEVVGGVTTAGGAGVKGLTLMGRGLGAKAAITEGAGYGALVGAGNADEGNRAEGALTGAVFGGATAGTIDKIGRGVSSKIASIKNKPAPAPTIDDLGAQANALYQKAEKSGITIKPAAMKKLGNNIMLKAGRINDKLRPKTAGVVEDFSSMMGKPASLKEFDEMRQQIGAAMQRAEPQDLRVLTLMKEEMDRFASKINAKDVTGDIKGFGVLKEARNVYQRKAKAEVLQEIFQKAEIDTGQYSQSGVANTLGKYFRQLSKNKKKMRMFSPDEQAAIIAIAKGETSSATTRFLSKFAPRGVVSAILSTAGGTMVGGPAGLAVPLVGHAAAKRVDQGAITAARTLQDNMARGFVPQLPKPSAVTNLRVPAGGVLGGQVSDYTRRQLSGSR